MNAATRLWRRARGAPFGIALIVVAMLASACGGGASADQPPHLALGEDTCHRCHMIVSEEKYAAGLVAKHGDQVVFDDTGEMIATVQEGGLGDQRAWTHDYLTSTWLDATIAYYVVSTSVLTPMGTGVVAFSTQDAAATFAVQDGGEVRSWDAMLSGWTMGARAH